MKKKERKENNKLAFSLSLSFQLTLFALVHLYQHAMQVHKNSAVFPLFFSFFSTFIISGKCLKKAKGDAQSTRRRNEEKTTTIKKTCSKNNCSAFLFLAPSLSLSLSLCCLLVDYFIIGDGGTKNRTKSLNEKEKKIFMHGDCCAM